MNTPTECGRFIGLEIPVKYYRNLQQLQVCSYNKRDRLGRPITNQWVYDNYRTIMERLTQWLLDEVILMGYGTEAQGMPFLFIGLNEQSLTIQKTDNPFDCYWTMTVVDRLSDTFGFSGLLERWTNDP